MRNTWMRTVAAMSLAASLAAGAAFAGSGDVKLNFRVPEPFRVGATVYPAGTLSIRTVQKLNPVATVHEVWVDGTPLGFMVLRSGRSEAPVESSAAVFERRGSEPLVLVGYSVPGTRTGTFYRVPTERVSSGGSMAADTLLLASR